MTGAWGGSVATRTLEAVPLIDEVIFGERDWLDLGATELDELRTELLTTALDSHLTNCAPYRRFAQRRGIGSAADVTDDLARIPQLPVSLFKRHQVVSVAPEAIVHSFTSSGTSGVRSVIHRDDITLQRFCGSLRPDSPVLGDIVGGLQDDTGVILNLGPTRADASQVWFAYVMALLEQLAPMRYYVSGTTARLADAAADLARLVGEYEHVLLIGAPFMVADLIDFVTDQGASIDGADRLTVFTGGGWKRRQAHGLSPDKFRARARLAFDLADETQVRDVFNLVEVNSVFPECRCHNKHIPPWVHAFTRDPVTFDPQPAGTPGLLCYSDASAHSYPCFVISDDIGTVEDGECDCGRSGLRMKWERRLRGAAHQGCAETLAAGQSAPLSGEQTSSGGRQ